VCGLYFVCIIFCVSFLFSPGSIPFFFQMVSFYLHCKSSADSRVAPAGCTYRARLCLCFLVFFFYLLSFRLNAFCFALRCVPATRSSEARARLKVPPIFALLAWLCRVDLSYGFVLRGVCFVYDFCFFFCLFSPVRFPSRTKSGRPMPLGSRRIFRPTLRMAFAGDL